MPIVYLVGKPTQIYQQKKKHLMHAESISCYLEGAKLNNSQKKPPFFLHSLPYNLMSYLSHRGDLQKYKKYIP